MMDKETAVEYLTKLGTESLNSEMQAVREIGKTCVKIADFIEQQADQIEKMKCCTNCCSAWNGEPAEDSDECEDCINISNWGWDGGSGE